MRIVTLMENTVCREDLACEHGLSLYIETGCHRILFDAGQSDAFAENAEKLGVDLAAVDFAVLSHGHYDHGGGLTCFLERNRTAPIYINTHAFEPHFNAIGKNIGLDSTLSDSGRLIFTEDQMEIAPGITLLTCNDRPSRADAFGLTFEENGRRRNEDFRHEQYLLIEENGKRICISGCSHKGVVNIVRWLQPDVLVGGFHFMKLLPPAPALARAARELLESSTVYYTGHCTGQAQYAYLKQIMGHRLHPLSTGTVIAV